MKNIYRVFVLSLVVFLTACTSWLTAPQPGTNDMSDFFSTAQAAEQIVNGCYVPLMWEYSGSSYCNDWFFGDIVSDDALKGGQGTTDGPDAYDLENWKTNSTNGIVLDYYKAQYYGIARCNLAIEQISKMDIEDEEFTPKFKNRLLGEAHFLRAFYYFRLVRVFGGVPKVDFVIDDDTKWGQDRASVDEIYALIINDLEFAEDTLWRKGEYKQADLGRATKGAAQAMLLKVNLYRGNTELAEQWGRNLIESGDYDLAPTFEENFTLEGENNIESVFECQYVFEPTSDFGQGFGFSRGSFTQVQCRSRSSKLGGGWGWNHPTQNLYDEFEANDPRREATILVQTDDLIENPNEDGYLGNFYINKKVTLYEYDEEAEKWGWYVLSHQSRGPLNRKEIRYADVLLLYAEACEANGNETQAKWALEKVRSRARASVKDEALTDVLPEFPNYTISINGQTITPTLLQAIRHERRVELAMESHRWYDICRWKGFYGTGVKAHMDAYAATESEQVRYHIGEFIEGKHELFPIPNQEIYLNPTEVKNNFGY